MLLRTLARRLGYSALNRQTAEVRMLDDVTGHMREARAIFERRFAGASV
jgi:hypothetical protein